MSRVFASSPFVIAIIVCSTLSLSARHVLADDKACPTLSKSSNKLSDETVARYIDKVSKISDPNEKFAIVTQCANANLDRFSFAQLAMMMGEAVTTKAHQDQVQTILDQYAQSKASSFEVLGDSIRLLLSSGGSSAGYPFYLDSSFRVLRNQIRQTLISDFDRRPKDSISPVDLERYLSFLQQREFAYSGFTEDLTPQTMSVSQRMISEYIEANQNRLTVSDYERLSSLNKAAGEFTTSHLAEHQQRTYPTPNWASPLIKFRQNVTADLNNKIRKAQAELIIPSQPNTQCPEKPADTTSTAEPTTAP